MGKYNSLWEIEGKVDDVVFYTIRGRKVIRKVGRVSAERRQKDPAFRRMRENMSEFGVCSAYGKMIRDQWGGVLRPFFLGWTDARLVSLLRREVLERARGEAGRRPLLLSRLGRFLEGFELNLDNRFSRTVRVPFRVRETEDGRVSLTIPAFRPEYAVSAPPGATHFRWYVHLSGLPDCVWQQRPVARGQSPARGAYVMVSPELAEKPVLLVSDGIPLKGEAEEVRVDLGFCGGAGMVTVGIEFLLEDGHTGLHAMAAGLCMAVVKAVGQTEAGPEELAVRKTAVRERIRAAQGKATFFPVTVAGLPAEEDPGG